MAAALFFFGGGGGRRLDELGGDKHMPTRQDGNCTLLGYLLSKQRLDPTCREQQKNLTKYF